MSVIMRKHMGEKQLLCIEASSRFGEGHLYITDRAVAYEVDMMGLYLNFIPLDMIREVRPSGSALFGAKRFVIVWCEGDATHSFEIRTKNHAKLQGVLGSVLRN